MLFLELIDPCTYTKCGDGQICKSVKVVCKKASCPIKAICVPDGTCTATALTTCLLTIAFTNVAVSVHCRR